jgi:CMP-N-acetylneuraminic acid synthetase
MSLLGIIPARAGSRGIKNKNIQWLGKKQLYRWVLETAYRSKIFDKIIISTNISEILNRNHLRSNVEVKERPEELCGDEVSVKDVIKHHLLESDVYYDQFAILQPTSPFLRVDDIFQCMYQFELAEIHSAQTIRKVKHLDHAYNQRRIDGNKIVKFVYPESRTDTRKQGQPEHYTFGNLIITDTNYFLKTNDLFGVSIGVEIPWVFGIDIDYPEDLELAEALVMKKGLLYDNSF